MPLTPLPLRRNADFGDDGTNFRDDGAADRHVLRGPGRAALRSASLARHLVRHVARYLPRRRPTGLRVTVTE
ncbi:hypothetical protein [Streptomyces sp. NBC_00878]|uniref:hypothetical protein n=1 Tax=Streptomyces sp. NBC_00878 TaxID=2975854 RepID=UPI00225AFFA5|nr:hypothetical protein [Streptomyces sp. NBC_00878]MCX4906816.1 hypothetical protein [Streptomyces sp. NBC_00878]